MSPACLKFEQTLAWHCAPALAGIKPADLIFWEPAEADWAPLLGHYAALLARRGIHIRVLGPGPRIPLLIFRPVQLRAWLSEPSVSVMLKAAGYPADGSLETLLQHLRERLRESSFPHEIGLFLGYPPTDVAGFLAYGGRRRRGGAAPLRHLPPVPYGPDPAD